MEKETKKIGPKQVIRYAWKKYMTEKGNFIPLFLLRIIITFGGLIPAIYYKQIVDIISQVTKTDASNIANHAIAILFIILWIKVANVFMYRGSDFFLIKMSVNISKKIYMECFNYIQQHSYRFFTNNFTGALIKKINKNVGAVDRISDIFVFDISSIVFNSIFILIVIGIQNIYFSVILLAWIIIFMIVQYRLYKRNYPYEIEGNIRDSKVSGALSDAITNNMNIKTFASLEREYGLFHDVVSTWRRITQIKRMRAMLIWLVTGLLTAGLEFIMFYFAILSRKQGIVSIGMFVLLQIYLFRIMDQMRNIGNVFRYLYQSFGECAEMLEILETPHEIQDISDEKLHIHDGKIEFKEVNFHYVKENPVFQGLNLHIKPGEKVAIVGASGGGKTTVVKLLFRFFDIQGGEILIDGQNIAQVTQNSLRSNISMVPQDPILFHRTLRENIAYGKPDASEKEIIAAAKMARCHEFIIGFKEGYETLVGERGIKLSGGERQRVAIARAILENKGILVMDEATSSLDSESEKLIQEAMDEVLRNKTAIVIAHRLSTIMKMDKIIVMEQGKIIEKGSHKELLAKDNGIYKKLRDIQSGGFIE
ncbi:MAG: ABC transporter ATP-binding protein [Candidatus Absconditabacterales bacterium]